MTPPVYESRDEMVQSWKGVLTALKKLLARPNIDVHGDSYVSGTNHVHLLRSRLTTARLSKVAAGKTPFLLAFTGFDNKEHVKALGKV